jgi:hypothetical protein
VSIRPYAAPMPRVLGPIVALLVVVLASCAGHSSVGDSTDGDNRTYDVHVVFPLSSAMPAAEELPTYGHLEDLVANSADDGLGQYDGNDIGASEYTVNIYSDVVGPTVKQLRKALKGAKLPSGSRIEVYRTAAEDAGSAKPILVQPLP